MESETKWRAAWTFFLWWFCINTRLFNQFRHISKNKICREAMYHVQIMYPHLNSLCERAHSLSLSLFPTFDYLADYTLCIVAHISLLKEKKEQDHTPRIHSQEVQPKQNSLMIVIIPNVWEKKTIYNKSIPLSTHSNPPTFS